MEYFNIHGFYHVIPNLVVRNEPNFDRFQGKYRRSDSENIGSVCLMVREKIGLQTDRQTDGHGDNISVFFPMRKKALKMKYMQTDKIKTIIYHRKWWSKDY